MTTEYWADMFMTWVLSSTGEKTWSGQAIEWDEAYRMHANFKYAYTRFMARYLMAGEYAPVLASDPSYFNEALVGYVAQNIKDGKDRLPG